MNIKLRHIIILFLSFTLISCSQTKEDRARQLFEESILPRMGNPDLYEFVKMTPLDSVYSSLNIDWTYLDLKDSLKKYTLSPFDMLLSHKEYLAKRQKEEEYKKAVKEYEESFVPQFLWCSTITFRAENLIGAKWLYTADVYFNKDLSYCYGWFYRDR